MDTQVPGAEATVGPPPEEPIDYQLVRTTAQQVESLALATTSRASLDNDAALLTELVRRMIREDYPNRLPATMGVFRAAYRVLDSPANPTPLDSDYRAYSHVKNLGRTAGALADVLEPPPLRGGFVGRTGLPPEHRRAL
ncbi:hypothetical protein ACFRAO_18660 [Streptomyces sp. NPDC056656]|uniref:hypothetical protein n=1 Tax=Streptomyces sp. NPDC056656 TaxID=3345895 RepID=UPI00369CFEED